jgi:gamma-glutamylcyclotransferase (GGCT)/AIG2-like uncharacterized protein YtfP
MLSYLFVYGQLRRGYRLHGELLRVGGRFVASARIIGTLFDLGKYTGAIAEGESVIEGELYRIVHPRAGLRALDALEGPEFRRAMVRARTGAGTRRAWAFLLRRAPR